jgi:glutamate-1-semialdehyde 2,1-aminomutase
MGHGALILGHSHPAIVKAVQEQVARGTHYGENHELEIEWAELIKSMMSGVDRVEFCACGQGANLLALRLARMYTGRRKILRFVENFHGWADEMVAVSSPGIVADAVTVIPGNDLARVEKELASKEYAILMTEGGGCHMGGQIPWETDFIHAIPDLTCKYGTVWLIDEVVTGFRDSRGGWQATVGVVPDLTTLGKTVGGGLGVGAVVGRGDIMDFLEPKAPPEPSMRHTGTWNSNPLTAAAGVAACRLYQDGKVQERANQLGAYLRHKGNRALKEKGLSVRLYGHSIVHIYIGPIDYEPADDTLPPTKDAARLMSGADMKRRLCLHLLQRGIATMGARFFIMSTAHTEDDIDQTVTALLETLDAMVAEGSYLQ